MHESEENSKNIDSTTELAIIEASKKKLEEEAAALLSQVVNETDVNKTKDLTYLFNINQTKKTMVRVNKLNDLLDTITDQAIARFSSKPDNISNQELLSALKVVQDAVEKSQKTVLGQDDQPPLIQINQQTNSVNVDMADKRELNRRSRENVKNAVMSVLRGLGVDQAVMPNDDVIEISSDNTTSEESENL